jgi:transcriptional regulator with XRE-family HTH domain
MQERLLANVLRRYMNEKQLSQKDIAKQVGVHQSTVSRALSGEVLRRGKGRQQLCKYMQQLIKPQDWLDGKDIVVSAFESIWDGSDDHAAAIARIIRASEGLRPDHR